MWSAICADEFPECPAGVGRSPLPCGGVALMSGVWFVTILFLFYLLVFWPHGMCDLCSSASDETRTPLQWKHGVLTTGPPGRSPLDSLILQSRFWWKCSGIGHLSCNTWMAWGSETPKPQVSNYLCLSGIQVAHVWAQVTFIGADPAHLGCLQSTLKTFTQNLFSEKIFSQSTTGQGSQPWCHIVLGPMPPDTISLMNVTLSKRNIQLSGQKDISR